MNGWAAPTAPPTSPPSPPPAGGAGPSTARRVLSWIGVVLVCAGVVASTLAVWVHLVVLNTDAFVATVRPVLSDPAVGAALGDAAAGAAVEALGVQQRLADGLPGAAGFVAAPLTAAVSGAVERGIDRVLSSPAFQNAWEITLRATHARAVALLRGDTTVAGLDGDALVLDSSALVGAALREVQRSMPGLIPAGVALPDPGSETAEQRRARLSAALGRPLPAGFGQIVLVRGPAVAGAQQAVRWLDGVALALPVATLILGALTVWLAPRRLPAVAAIGLGSAGALLVMLVAGRLLGPPLVAGAAQGPLGQALGPAVLSALLGSLSAVAAVVVIAGAALGAGALVAEHRRAQPV